MTSRLFTFRAHPSGLAAELIEVNRAANRTGNLCRSVSAYRRMRVSHSSLEGGSDALENDEDCALIGSYAGDG